MSLKLKRADGRTPSGQHRATHTHTKIHPRGELKTRGAKIPDAHPQGKHLFLKRKFHFTELGLSSKQKTDGSRCIREKTELVLMTL